MTSIKDINPSRFPNPILVIGPNGVLLDANSAATKAFQLKEADFNRDWLTNRVVAADHDAVQTDINRIKRGEQGLVTRNRIIVGDTFVDTAWQAHLDEATGTIVASGWLIPTRPHYATAVLHDLRNTLQSAHMAVEVAAKNAPENQYAERALRSVELACEVATGLRSLEILIRDNCAITSAQVLEHSRPLLESLCRDRNLTLDLEGDVTLVGHPPDLITVVHNLISNAAKATVRGGQIGIRLQRTSPKSALLSISDSGDESPSNQSEKVVLANSSRGLGFEIIRAILDEYDVKWAFQANSSGGMDVRLDWPLSA